jgi:DNA-binding CsgD family transcriptional regulator
MVLTRTDENELLTALYAGVFDAPPWGLFLARLRAKTDADICRIWLRPGGDTASAWREVQSAASRTAGDRPNDLAPFGDLRPGRVYGGAELGGMVATNGRYMRVSAPGGGDIAISMVRGASDFSARSAALLSDLAPHLSIALRTLTGLERAQLRGSVAAFAHARLAVGWLLLDDRGRILECDGLATEMLAEGTAMRQAGDGRLRLPYPKADALLDMIMRSPGLLAEGPRAAWLDLTPPVQIVFMAPSPDKPPSLAPPACLALIRPVARPDGSQWRMLSDLFGLTRSESALALGMANGEGIVGAGAGLGLTVETARNYSKRIYAKTGARGQADLVRIIMAGVTGFV